MYPQFRRSLATLTTGVLLSALAHGQSRKLGPDTAKAIQETKLDPAFQTTKLDRVALLPWANTSQYKDAAGIISKSFVSQLSQMHSDYKFISPDETINFVSKSHLDDQYNIFLGDYLTSGAARSDFLAILHDQLQIDAVFVGRITDWGLKQEHLVFLGRPRVKKVYVVGLETSLYRTTDGRRIWYGKDLIAVPKQDQLTQAAETISEVFARFFGRSSY